MLQFRHSFFYSIWDSTDDSDTAELLIYEVSTILSDVITESFAMEVMDGKTTDKDLHERLPTILEQQ
jgi:hypothetical protein